MVIGALLLALIVLGTASLLRAGRTLLDRLLLAAVLVAALAVPAGFAFTFWPWGLHPFGVSVVAFLALGAAALVTGRRPRLPLRGAGSDLVLLGGTAFAVLVTAWPTLGARSLAETWAYSAITGDRMRHFNLFDGIRRIGGFPFLDDGAAPIVQDEISRAYPQTAHYLYALVDSFLTGGGGLADPVAEYGRYYAYVIAGYGFLALATMWAVRWIAGPGTAGWRHCLATAAAGGIVATGTLTTMIWCSFDPQVLSIAFLAVAAALLARGPQRPAEHTALAAAAASVAVAAYPMYAMFLVVAAAAGLIAYRRRLRRQWIRVAAVAAAAAAVTAVPILMAQSAGLDAGSHLQLRGYVIRPSWTTLAVLALAALVGVLLPRARRSPVLRTYGIGLAGGAAALLAVAVFQLATIGELAYYFDKGVQAYLVLLIVGAGAVVRSLPAVVRAGERRRAVLAGIAATAAGVVLVGAVGVGEVRFDRDAQALGGDTTWGRVWASGDYFRGPHAPALAYLATSGLLDGTPTIAVTSPDGGTNANVSVGIAVLQHDLGALREQVYATGYAPADLTVLEDAIVAATGPLRLVTNDPAVAAHFRTYAANNPGLDFTVLFDAGIPG